MTLQIRRAEASDADTLFDLVAALAEFERLPPPDADARARLREHGWGERPRFEAWLAVLDGHAVGYLILLHTYSTFLARPTLYMEDVFVLPEYRKQGIGRALFEHAVRLAGERGCGRMEWCCLDWNVAAQRFYEASGARRLSEWVYYRLIPVVDGTGATGDLDAA